MFSVEDSSFYIQKRLRMCHSYRKYYDLSLWKP